MLGRQEEGDSLGAPSLGFGNGDPLPPCFQPRIQERIWWHQPDIWSLKEASDFKLRSYS